MVANSLRDDLLGIPGVEGAEIDGSQDAPAGLRIRIAEGADQHAVGGAIRSVLSSHGFGTDTRLPGEAPHEPDQVDDHRRVAVLTGSQQQSDLSDGEPKQEERTIIDLTDKSPNTTEEASPVADDEGRSHGSTGESGGLPPFIEPRPQPVDAEASVSSVQSKPDEGVPTPSLGSTIAKIERVSVEEGRSGIVVTVGATDGTEVSQVATSTEGGVEAAVVKAAAKLVDATAPDPIVVDIEDRRVEGVDIVMIVLDLDGDLVAGSAIVAAGRAFALGRATWAALSF